MENSLTKKYLLKKKIGAGEFGEIFIGENKVTGREVAIKIGIDKDRVLINNEAKIYNVLADEKGYPKMRGYGKEGEYSYIVMDLLGKSLEVKRRENGKYSIKEVICIGLLLLRKLERLHELGYIHRDLKPENIVYDREGKDIYIIDYGLAKGYMKNGEHIENRKINSIIGTPRYISLNIHRGNMPSRRDDIEALGYILVYLLVDKLPWEGIEENDMNKRLKIVEKIKREENILDIYPELPMELLTIIEYSRKLKYVDCPNYKYLRGILNNLLEIL